MEIRTMDPAFSLDGVLEALGAVGIKRATVLLG